MMRFYDAWFFSNSYNMNKFSTLYDSWEAYGIKNPHSECVHHIYQTGLNENLKHVFYEIKDHDNIRARFENCEYNPNQEFDTKNLKQFSSYPKQRFIM